MHDRLPGELPHDVKKELHPRDESVTTGPGGLEFIDRFFADSRMVALKMK